MICAYIALFVFIIYNIFCEIPEDVIENQKALLMYIFVRLGYITMAFIGIVAISNM